MELVIRNLSKRYPNGVQALKDVSLTIRSGMFGLLGPNGAGKSTLMRTLATLQDADSGSATLDGVDVLKEKDAVRKMLGYLPQEFGLYPKVSALELLDHFAMLKGIEPASTRQSAVHALLKKTNLYSARHARLGTYSGGMKQRFGIAQALLGDPRLVIVDEPTAGLDPEERGRFHDLLSEIGENIVVILSTHIVSDVSELCSEMAVINHGTVVVQGEPLKLSDELRGRMWKKSITREELAEFEKGITLISARRQAGQTIVRVRGNQPPDPAFEPANPDVEDVYFCAIRGYPIQRPPPETIVAESPTIEQSAPEPSPATGAEKP